MYICVQNVYLENGVLSRACMGARTCAWACVWCCAPKRKHASELDIHKTSFKNH